MTRLRVASILWAGMVLAGISSAAKEQAIKIPAFIKQVDAKCYYPQQHGLRDLSVKVIMPELESKMATQKIALKTTYYWKAPNQEKFAVSGFPKGQEANRAYVEQLLKSGGAAIISRPTAEALKTYQLTAVKQGNLVIIRGTLKQPGTGPQKMALWFRNYELIRMDADQGGAEVRMTQITTVKKGGQLLPASMRGELIAQGKSQPLSTKLSYTQVKGITLVSQIITKVGGQTVTMKFSGHKVNQGVPDSVFK